MVSGAARVLCERGLSIVEVLVAQLLLLVGVLALSSTASVVASRLESAELETRVRVAAEAQLERLLADGGSGAVSGRAQRGALQLEWSVSGGDPRHIVLTARGKIGRHAAADTLETRVSR